MIPIIPALVLTLLSLLCSFFVILRTLVPVLPPHPFSSRVSPNQFGLPTFRKKLSVTHKTQIWLALSDIIAAAFFLWQVIFETVNGGLAGPLDTNLGSSIRLTIAITVRATCFAAVILMTVAQVRSGRSVSLGRFQSFVWVPTLLGTACAAVMAGSLAGAQIKSLFFGLTAYSAVVTTLSTVSFALLVKTLNDIRHNLGVLPQQIIQKRSRPSFTTEDIDALREGSSWLTSTAGSQRESMSQWSFSTWHTPLSSSEGSPASARDPRLGSSSSLAPKSSFWFGKMGSSEQIPPVPPLPSTYRHSEDTIAVTPVEDDKEFHKALRTARVAKSSNDSWLTSPSVSQETMSAFSFPTSRAGTPAPSSNGHVDKEFDDEPRFITEKVPSVTPAISPKVLGGYGYEGMVEKGTSTCSGSSRSRRETDVAFPKIVLWFLTLWIPCALSIPAFISGILSDGSIGIVFSILLTLSITIPSPMLVLSVLTKAPIPQPSNLFLSSKPLRAASFQPALVPPVPPADSLEDLRMRGISTSTFTVIEGRRSGDVWMSNGDAVEGKSRLGRALTMLQPSPPLSVLPQRSTRDEYESFTPPEPLRSYGSEPQTPQSAISAELGRCDPAMSSKSSTYYSATGGNSSAYTTSSRVIVSQNRSHLRSRSASSTQSTLKDPLSPPPPLPLPPTPGRGEARNVGMRHQRSFSSTPLSTLSKTSTGRNPRIDALAAALLPMLVPGIVIDKDAELDGPDLRPGSAPSPPPEDVSLFNPISFSSVEGHSTPKQSKAATRKKHHFSLPSLSISKDVAFKLWRSDTNNALERTAFEAGGKDRRVTLAEYPAGANLQLMLEEQDEVQEEIRFEPPSPQNNHRRQISSVSVYPEGIESARSSMQTLLDMVDSQLSQAPSPSIRSKSSKSSKISIDSNKENVHAQARKQPRIKYIAADQSSIASNESRYSRSHIMPYEHRPRPNDVPESVTKLRPLSLLSNKGRNTHSSSGTDSLVNSPTAPLSMGKRQTQASKLRPLQLARSATSKARGVLRKNEVLPQVVVRPPSNAEKDIYHSSTML